MGCVMGNWELWPGLIVGISQLRTGNVLEKYFHNQGMSLLNIFVSPCFFWCCEIAVN
jgi:hypothetical protein